MKKGKVVITKKGAVVITTKKNTRNLLNNRITGLRARRLKLRNQLGHRNFKTMAALGGIYVQPERPL